MLNQPGPDTEETSVGNVCYLSFTPPHPLCFSAARRHPFRECVQFSLHMISYLLRSHTLDAAGFLSTFTKAAGHKFDICFSFFFVLVVHLISPFWPFLQCFIKVLERICNRWKWQTGIFSPLLFCHLHFSVLSGLRVLRQGE